MSEIPGWLEPAADALGRARAHGALVLSEGRVRAGELRTYAESLGFQFQEVEGAVAGLVPEGALRMALPELLGGLDGAPDAGVCAEAVGDGEGAKAAWRALIGDWRPTEATVDLEVEVDLAAPAETTRAVSPVARMAVLARVLVAAAELTPRCVLVHDADRADGGSLDALRVALAGGRGSGLLVVLEGAAPDAPLRQLFAPVQRASADGRFDGPGYATLGGEALDPPSHNLPSKGSAVELLALLAAGATPVPEAILDGASLAAYRGHAPRSTWQDFEGVLAAGRGRVVGGFLVVDVQGADAPSPLPRADARALRAAVDGLSTLTGSQRVLFAALLSARAGDGDALGLALSAARDLLARGDAFGASRLLEQTAGSMGPARSAVLGGTRAAAAETLGDATTALRHVRETLSHGEEAPLHLAAGRLSATTGDEKAAQRHLEAAVASAGADLGTAGAAWLLLARLHAESGRHAAGAAAAAEAARAWEQAGDTLGAAQAFAVRATCIGGAGQGERALKELKLAMQRTPDSDDPRPEALDVRIAMGLIFRDTGNRDKARQALGLAAKRAEAHGLLDREAEARLTLARFHLEGLPVRGPERGEALAAGRESAEAAIHLARSLGRSAVEAEAEALLGELAWRAEDWVSAGDALAREQALWTQTGNLTRVVDVALRRGQIATRRQDWKGALEAAGAALAQAQRRRLGAKLAQAHLLRAEALEHLDRKEEALMALQEAQRVFGSLGEEFAAQAVAAERRARQLIAGG